MRFFARHDALSLTGFTRSQSQKHKTASSRLNSLTCISELQQEFYSRPLSGYNDSGLLPLRKWAHGFE
jgi:hypothetical protein